MKWLRRILIGVGARVVLLLAVAACGSLLSLDWDETHRAQAAALAELDSFGERMAESRTSTSPLPTARSS